MRECKLLHIRYNLFAGTEMLSLSVYESTAKEILHGGNRPPISGRRSSYRVGCGTPRKSSVLGKMCLLEPKCYLSPFTSQLQNKFFIRGSPPNLGEMGGVRGSNA